MPTKTRTLDNTVRCLRGFGEESFPGRNAKKILDLFLHVKGFLCSTRDCFRSMAKNYLQFVLVCRSLFQFVLFAPSLKIWRESMGSNLGHGFPGHSRRFRGSRWTGEAPRVISRTSKPMSYLGV